MGVYDTIILRCPKCGEEYQAQSKSGDCYLKVMTLEEAIAKQDPALPDVNRHAPFQCFKCGAIFYVKMKLRTQIVIDETPTIEIFEWEENK